MYVSFYVKNVFSNSPVRLDGDHPRPYCDQKMYQVAGKREHNARKSPKITNLKKSRSYRDLCDHTAFARRARHDLSALMAFLLRSMGLATVITGDPAALSPRSWGSRVLYDDRDCTATSRRFYHVLTATI